ncbi:hypothetical protein A3G14_04605 [Candidatus Curtissbacteria bacterium RIFCSPLOWO2_12_FULL_38_9]|uniref:Glycosyltransferase 2-like domain-containing protein n=1 Tax=Candidatus Curtissbacteria bacterium RIFCSPLOWO2_12_FULL_38_9 TaxID=1797735 RepID=A0A1F5IB67_9BACT|nr:MAG: hypothetical protein A3G14_04605 [Candidatus Curtissbacteria bacterium RIFCSPLOWO2_12_FULL_38_9]
MKISVIISTKNEQKNIKRLLKSLKKQSFSGFETILVDNFSFDQTSKIAKPFVDKLLHTGNERSSQRNYGAKKASGKWLLFLDADMQLKKKALKEYWQLASSSKKSIIALPEISIGKTFWGKAISVERNCYIGQNLLTAARMFPRKDFTNQKGFDKNLIAAEDWDLTNRFIKAGFDLKIAKTPLFHFEPEENLINMIKKEIYYINNIEIYSKKYPKIFSKQSSISYRLSLWAKSWNILIKNPLSTFGFLFYKFSVWILWQLKKNKIISFQSLQ